mgnify:FL=1|jgi:YggT family protein
MGLIIEFFGYFVQFYSFAMLVYILIGYFPEARGTKFYEILEAICRPLLNLFRFATFSGISFAPILAIMFLQVIYFLLTMLV